MSRPIYMKWKIVHIWRDENDNDLFHILAKNSFGQMEWTTDDISKCDIGTEFATEIIWK